MAPAWPRGGSAATAWRAGAVTACSSRAGTRLDRTPGVPAAIMLAVSRAMPRLASCAGARAALALDAARAPERRAHDHRPRLPSHPVGDRDWSPGGQFFVGTQAPHGT
jgi:hypothetical protein